MPENSITQYKAGRVLRVMLEHGLFGRQRVMITRALMCSRCERGTGWTEWYPAGETAATEVNMFSATEVVETQMALIRMAQVIQRRRRSRLHSPMVPFDIANIKLVRTWYGRGQLQILPAQRRSMKLGKWRAVNMRDTREVAEVSHLLALGAR